MFVIVFLHQAYYNWAIAISDRAKMRGRTKEAEELWKQVQTFSLFFLFILHYMILGSYVEISTYISMKFLLN